MSDGQEVRFYWNGRTYTPEEIETLKKRKYVEYDSGVFRQLSEQIAALAAALTARDRQLSAISEQVRLGFEAIQAQMQHTANVGDLVAHVGEQFSSRQQKTNELFVAIDCRLKAMEKKAKRKR